MQRSVVESGIGGQGILVTSKLMCYAGTEAGLRTMHYALYAGSVRGGVANARTGARTGWTTAGPCTCPIRDPSTGTGTADRCAPGARDPF